MGTCISCHLAQEKPQKEILLPFDENYRLISNSSFEFLTYESDSSDDNTYDKQVSHSDSSVSTNIPHIEKKFT